MPPLISYIEKTVLAQGVNPHHQIIAANLGHHLFEDEFLQLEKLKNLPKITLPTANPYLLYPGSGSDVLHPLFFLEIIDHLKQVAMTFIDRKDHLGMIKTILDDLGLSFAEEQDGLTFYWKKILVRLRFVKGDIFTLNYPCFDIYFERKLALFKEKHEDYEAKVMGSLNPGGLIISDHGFTGFKLKRMVVLPKLSSYQGMIIGIKLT